MSDHVVALIPARGGEADGRNALTNVAGRSLLEYTMAAAAKASSLSRVVVTTDDERIRTHARALGAEVPFLRPATLARSGVSLDEVVRDSLSRLEIQGMRVDVCVVLEVTHPLRPEGVIDEIVATLTSSDCDTVIAAAEERGPFWTIDADGQLRGLQTAGTRATRQPLYRQLSGLASASYARTIREGAFIGQRVGLVPVRDYTSLIDTGEELGLELFRLLVEGGSVPGRRSESRA